MTGPADVGQADAPAAALDCDHQPDPDTAYTSTGLPADLRYRFNDPVEARCLLCGKWIRCEQYAVTGPDPVWHLKYPEQSCTG